MMPRAICVRSREELSILGEACKLGAGLVVG